MNIIKPFKWSFPYKFGLSKDDLFMLEAPVPVYCGFDKSMGLFKILTESIESEKELNVFYIEEDILEKSV